MTAILTDHAVLRGKERLNLNRKSLQRMADRALEKGVRHSDTNGLLNKYLSDIWDKRHSINNLRIYGEILYLFQDVVLVTVLWVPAELKGILAKTRRRIET